MAEAIRSCWVKEPMPEAAMNPYFKGPRVGFAFKLRQFIRRKHQLAGGDYPAWKDGAN